MVSRSHDAITKPAAVPEQVSAVSQTPLDERQVVAFETNALFGHVAEVPVQFSAMSQMPPEARQTVVLATRVSDGHAPVLPVQFSATSQTPPEGRQTVAAESKQLSFSSWQLSPQMPPAAQGSPE